MKAKTNTNTIRVVLFGLVVVTATVNGFEDNAVIVDTSSRYRVFDKFSGFGIKQPRQAGFEDLIESGYPINMPTREEMTAFGIEPPAAYRQSSPYGSSAEIGYSIDSARKEDLSKVSAPVSVEPPAAYRQVEFKDPMDYGYPFSMPEEMIAHGPEVLEEPAAYRQAGGAGGSRRPGHHGGRYPGRRPGAGGRRPGHGAGGRMGASGGRMGAGGGGPRSGAGGGRMGSLFDESPRAGAGGLSSPFNPSSRQSASQRLSSSRLSGGSLASSLAGAGRSNNRNSLYHDMIYNTRADDFYTPTGYAQRSEGKLDGQQRPSATPVSVDKPRPSPLYDSLDGASDYAESILNSRYGDYLSMYGS